MIITSMGSNFLKPKKTTTKKRSQRTLYDFGLLSRRSLNILTALSFLLISAGAGVFINYSSHAATPEIESGLSTINNTFCMDDKQGLAVNDNPVDIYQCNGTSAQQWSVNSNHTITIKGMCLDIYQGGQTNG